VFLRAIRDDFAKERRVDARTLVEAWLRATIISTAFSAIISNGF
jgi:hypothetical protein